MKKEIAIKKFSVVEKQDERSKQAKEKVVKSLLEHGFIEDVENPDLVISVGGDGTLLYAVHKYIKQLDHLYFVAIHTGNLGFFTDYKEEEINECIEDIAKGNVYEIFESSLLETKIQDKTLYALNEIRIENILRTQTLDIYIDDEYFETFKGNGISLSTQAGSTAYNRSLSAAVVDSGLSLLQLTEIAGIHNSKHRSLGVPYILKDDRKVTFKSDNFNKSYLCYDHKQMLIEANEPIECYMSNKKVKFVRYRKYSYLERVRTLY